MCYITPPISQINLHGRLMAIESVYLRANQNNSLFRQVSAKLDPLAFRVNTNNTAASRYWRKSVVNILELIEGPLKRKIAKTFASQGSVMYKKCCLAKIALNTLTPFDQWNILKDLGCRIH